MNTPNYNEITNDLLRPFLHSVENCLHGYIILIDGQIWKRSLDGNFIFPTRKKAIAAFYSNMRWTVARRFGSAQNAFNYYENASFYWKKFKEILGDRFEIKYI